MRFSELKQHVPAVTAKVLTERLRQLERDGLVTRTQYNEMPPRVEYASTPLAHSLSTIFASLHEWSDAHIDDVVSARRSYDAVRDLGSRLPKAY